MYNNNQHKSEHSKTTETIANPTNPLSQKFILHSILFNAGKHQNICNLLAVRTGDFLFSNIVLFAYALYCYNL